MSPRYLAAELYHIYNILKVCIHVSINYSILAWVLNEGLVKVLRNKCSTREYRNNLRMYIVDNSLVCK